MSDPFANLNLNLGNPQQSQQAQQALAQLMQQAQQGRNVPQGQGSKQQVDPRAVSFRVA